MSGIFGLIGLADSDRSFVNVIGQSVVYAASQQLFTQYNQDLNTAMSVFVDSTTSGFKERYKLPGGGRLQRRGGRAQSAAVKQNGSWDVAYPLEDFGAALAETDVAMAYMTMDQYNTHLDTIMIQDMNTVRFEMLRALFNSTAGSFVDPINGTLSIERLANGDSVVYPPVLGSETEATENHYLESGYAATAISDTNNPYITIRGEIEEHFGASTGGDNICVFVHPDEVPETEDLRDFDAVPDNYIRTGTNVNVPQDLPNVPGRIVGRTNGVWVVEWRWIPSGYMFGVHLDAPKPLKMRVDPPDTGLGVGLQLVSTDTDYPLQYAHYRHRFGFGVGNRLNGVVLELGTGGSYTVPSVYA